MSKTAIGTGTGKTQAEANVRAAAAAGAALAMTSDDTCADAHQRAHALLGPSSAERWLACPPSARLEERLEEKTSEAANEGTSAHTLVDILLRGETTLPDSPEQMAVGRELVAFIANNSHYNGEMEEYAKEFVDFVMERFAEAQATCPDATMMTEQRLTYEDWVPEGVGTGDVVIVSDNILDVIDFKYGKGVPVEARENPQLRLYGAGAWVMFGDLYAFTRIRVTIYQPRINKVTTEEFSVDELVTWLNKTVKPLAALAWEGKGAFCAGEHCQFCKARTRCKTLADYHMVLAKYEFLESTLLTWEEIADILNRQKQFEAWLKAVHDYAEDQAVNHDQHIPGWKLVEGKSNRIIADPKAAKAALVKWGYPEPIIMKPPEMLGITALEGTVGKKRLTEILGGLIQKPPGKMTLAVESDTRAAMGSTDSARTDFSEQE